MTGRMRFIFEMFMGEHYFIYHVIADTARQARTRIKRAINNDGGPGQDINMFLDLVKVID